MFTCCTHFMWVCAIICYILRRGLCPEVFAICFSCVCSWNHLNCLLQQPMPGKSVYGLTFSCALIIISSPIFIPAICWSTRYHSDAPGRLQPKRVDENTGNVIDQNYHFPYFGWNAEWLWFENIPVLFTKQDLSIGAIVQGISCGFHSIGFLSLLRV